MSETIGQQLGAARESLKLTIQDVAHKTRIHSDVLIQLEADEYDKLPNLMFAKSFIKLYSEHVGVDASLAISQLTAANEGQDKQYLLGGINPKIRENFGRLTASIPIRPILASAAAFVCLMIGGSYLVSHLYGGEDQIVQPAPEKKDNSEAATTDAPLPNPSVDVVDTTPVSSEPPALAPKTLPEPPSEPLITESTPIDELSIPKAIRKATPVESESTGEEEAPDESETAASEETYEPFVVTPGVVVNED